MKTRYYYIRDDKNRPITTICLLKEGKETSRGVSICSDQDVPCKKVGRKIAFERAVYALANQTSVCELKKEVNLNFNTKATYMPTDLTKHEVKLLSDYKKEK